MTDPTFADIGQRVRAWRRQFTLTAAALASQAGISPATLSQIETGATSPGTATVERIREALGVTAAELVGYTPAERFLAERDQ